MATVLYPAIFEKSPEGFGVWFPDIDGCTSSGDSIEEAAANAAEALAFWFEDAKDAPAASSFKNAVERAAGEIVMLIQTRIPERVERVNISLTDSTLAIADQMAAEMGTTRSGLFSKLVHDMKGKLARARGGKPRAADSHGKPEKKTAAKRKRA
jgi:predicted RNase H-like HicB family nuclease